MLQGTLFPPVSSWRPPRLAELPQDWNATRRLAIDTETCDPQLRTLGPGVRRGAYICGFCLALDPSRGWYLPTRHLGGDNMEDPEAVVRYVRDQAARYTGEVVGANLGYDLDFMAEAGITFPRAKTFKDVLVAEPLLDELQYTYNLDAVLGRHGLEGKEETLFRDAIAAFGLNTKQPKADLHKLPARYVGPYGEGDVTKPLELLLIQERELDAQDLGRIWELEQAVTPVLIRMRRRGVLVNLDKLDRIERFSVAEETKAWGELQRLTGVAVRVGDAMKAEVVAHALRSAGVTVPLTAAAKPKPSITKEWLEALDHPAGKVIRRARKMSQLRTTFVSSIRNHGITARGGNQVRVHCTFNQLIRQEDDEKETEGAAYGRLSSSDPNLQQQPARDPELGPMWRGIYEPEMDTEWCSADYSQQEPRMAVHFGVASGAKRLGQALGSYDRGVIAHESAKRAAQAYIDDPKTDAHTMFTAEVHGPHVLEWARAADAGDKEAKRQLKLLRDPAKNIFLGICYAMGGPKLCRQLGLPTKIIVNERSGRRIEVAGDEGQALLNLVNRRVPYIQATARAVEAVAKERGYVITVGGRRCRFPRDAAGNFDWTHKTFNRLIQGSAADQTKRAMVELDREGIPLQLQVHDEFDWSMASRAEGERAAEIMIHCMLLHVPSKVDLEIGPSWGEAK